MRGIYEPAGRAREYSLLAANLYSGCPHGCLYCYAPAALHVSKTAFHARVSARDGMLAALDADARRYTHTRKLVLLCFTCDPYPADLSPECSITRAGIQCLRRYGIPFQVLTKGGARACSDFDLYSPRDAFATTLTWRTSEESLEMEPRAALPADRIDAIRLAKSLGIRTWVSLEPVFEPADALSWIDETQEFVDLYKVGTLNHSPVAKTIDWRSFGISAIQRLEALGKPYYIKDDLAKHLAGVTIHNTETRMI